jgi:predicted RNase H-like HicB family nuclease
MKKARKGRREPRGPLRYPVMIRGTATGYSVDVPDVPGCVAAARTVRGARRLIAEALALHLELLRKSGERIPLPKKSIEFTVDEAAGEEFCTWVEVEVPEPAASQP